MSKYAQGDIFFTKGKVHSEHVALYVGRGFVVHAVPFKVEITRLSELEEHWAFKLFGGVGAIYRVTDATDEEKVAVSQYASSLVFEPFCLFSTKSSDGFWNCGKLVWWSWLRGTRGRVNLDPYGVFVSAKDLRDSPYTCFIGDFNLKTLSKLRGLNNLSQSGSAKNVLMRRFEKHF